MLCKGGVSPAEDLGRNAIETFAALLDLAECRTSSTSLGASESDDSASSSSSEDELSPSARPHDTDLSALKGK